jgi:hypothetical protein
MKKLILFLFLLFSIAINAQKTAVFSQKLTKKKGIQLVLKSVVNDSRCPEGVSCIWLGECEIEVAVYKNRKLISTENIVLSPKATKENLEWFEKYYPNHLIKEINVLPYPKDGVLVNPKDYLIKMIFE